MAETVSPEVQALWMAPPDERMRRSVDLHPSVHRLWFWQSVIFALVLAVPGALIGLVKSGLVVAAAALVAVGVPALEVLYARAYARRFRCWLLHDGLLVARGVWWRSETFVPLARIQHTDVGQGPVARHYGIATLKVFTAGTVAGEVEVGGLGREDAVRLRDELLGREGSDAV